MADAGKLLEFLQKQMEVQQKQHQEQMEMLKEQNQKPLTQLTTTSSRSENVNIPSFSPFDSANELWSDYWARFTTFTKVHSVPNEKKAQVFLTNQSNVNFKLLSSYATQLTAVKDVNSLTMDEIEDYMKTQFDPIRFIVRERYKFWSDLTRKPGETIPELAARIRQDAVTCDFATITDPLDEALRTRFICSVNNEAILKALFRIKNDELTFAKAISVACETEDAARVAKETVHGTKHSSDVHKVGKKSHKTTSKPAADEKKQSSNRTCMRCGTTHTGQECKHLSTTCNYCKIKGHIEAVCLKKKRDTKPIKVIYNRLQASHTVNAVNTRSNIPQLEQLVCINDRQFHFEIDTGAGDNFCSQQVWEEIGQPALSAVHCTYESATGDAIPTLGSFETVVTTPSKMSSPTSLRFTVVGDLNLNLLGRDAITTLGIDVTAMLKVQTGKPSNVNAVFDKLKADTKLQAECEQLCSNFPDLFKPELGLLKDFQLDVKFKENAKPVFCKARTVPFAVQEELNQAYDTGIKRGVWERTQFSAYGTPVVPIRKPLLPGQTKAKIRVCGDYSVTVNPYLEDHRHPVPLPEDLMRKLSGGYGFTKIDLADAYNQIMLTPESQQKLALSTHRGVLLQRRLPFGIKSAPGYFQSIMEQLTSDLNGVAIYLDDILVSGTDAQDHLNNLQALLTRLQEKGLRCRREKCVFAQPVVEYLGHLLSNCYVCVMFACDQNVASTLCGKGEVPMCGYEQDVGVYTINVMFIITSIHSS